MSYLLDTNIISELRKRERANAGVVNFLAAATDADLFTSVLVLGELRRGVESLRRRDLVAASALEQWIARLADQFSERVLIVDSTIADRWGHLNVPDPVPTVDGLLAATALTHDLTLVTRNTRDIERTGVRFVNPFLE